MWIPTEDRAVWVDDEEFDLDYHMRHTALPLSRQRRTAQAAHVARILAQQLDRARPLWEMWVVEGLRGNRFAVITKVHHCMIDGISGIDLAQILFAPTPDYEIQEPPPFIPHTAPSRFELMRDSWLQRANPVGTHARVRRTSGWKRTRRAICWRGRERLRGSWGTQRSRPRKAP